MWVLCRTLDAYIPEIPDHVGILAVDGSEIIVRKPAGPGEGVGEKSGDLAKILLMKSLSR